MNRGLLVILGRCVASRTSELDTKPPFRSPNKKMLPGLLTLGAVVQEIVTTVYLHTGSRS